MRRKRIALVVDNVLRDLLGLVMVAHEVAQRGAICYLVPSEEKHEELMALRPDLVVMFNLRKSLDGFFQVLQDAGIAVVLSDAEGGVWPSLDEYSELLTTNREIRENLSSVCLWGKGMTSYLTSKGYFREEQLRITGCPRFDPYSPAWRELIEVNGDRRKPQILVNTNTAELNQRGISREALIAFFVNRYGWTKDRIETHLRIQAEAYGLTLEMIRSLVHDFPECRIVVRPHPFEDLQVYRKDLKGLDLRLTQEGPVAAELFNAVAMIQRSCTTGIEAGMSGVPALSPQWIPTAFHVPASEAVSLPSADYQQMRKALSAIVQGSFELPRQTAANLSEVLDTWFAGADGKAHLRVADVLMRALPAQLAVDEAKCLRALHRLGGAGRFGAKKAGRLVRFYAGLSPQFNFRKFSTVSNGNLWNGRPLPDLMTQISRWVAQLNGKKSGDQCPAIRVEQAAVSGSYSSGHLGGAVRLSPDAC